ncbi:MAG: anthranilate phosphoribosyltransferase [Hyphomonadaceae bacterium]|nr:anthranilate phosphoribosyltransferase [Hyphomonadaceae bacterium]
MSETLKPLLATIAQGGAPDPDALEAAFGEIMDGAATPAQAGAFLTATRPLMTDPATLYAGARAMRARMTPVAAPANAIDVCGTGGDGAHSLNISTAVAFVVAGCGVPVAKHGNRAMSSRSGAADVLEALGVRLTADAPTLSRCLAEANVAFLFAQNHHPAMRHVASARRELGFRTIFNLLGPLTNPAGVRRQLVGVFAPAYGAPVAHALARLGAESAWVVHGAGGLDELSCAGESETFALAAGSVEHRSVGPAAAGLPVTAVDAIRGGSAADNAAALRDLLEGRGANAAYEGFVLLNAAAALVVAGVTTTLADGVKRARASLRDGAARDALDQLIAITRGAP